jgi:polysaccharide pyruvyl transferase WcaK-like protein
MRFLIRGAGFINKGAEAMLLTLKEELLSRFQDAEFVYPAESIRNEQEVECARRNGFIIYKRKSETISKKIVRIGLATYRAPSGFFQFWVDRQSVIETLQMLDDIDAVFDVHGYAFGDPWGLHYAIRTERYVEHCRSNGIPYIFMPQSWGPFTDASRQDRYRRICRDADMLFVRDCESREYVANLLGKPAQTIRLGPDIAFRFNGLSESEEMAFLNTLGMDSAGRPQVGIAPNMRVFERMPGEGIENRYFQILLEITRLFLDYGATVILIPHEIKMFQDKADWNDDRSLISMVANAVNHSNLIAMTEDYSARQIKSVISKLDLLIGSRFHALVGAISSNVPVVALGWSHKYVELLRSVDLENYCSGHDEEDSVVILQQVQQAWRRRAELKEQLANCVPDIKASVDRVFAEVCAGIGAL